MVMNSSLNFLYWYFCVKHVFSIVKEQTNQQILVHPLYQMFYSLFITRSANLVENLQTKFVQKYMLKTLLRSQKSDIFE